MTPGNPIVNLIIQGARARGLDPAAVLAVASQEGLSGRIGDGGHAFGPFQLNDAGGVLTGKFPNLTPQQRQQWASSPAGINYALDGIAQVARGQRGQQAVNAIVTRFERPANPGREIAGANAAYGSYAGGYTAPPVPSPSTPAANGGIPGLSAPVPGRPVGNTLAILNEGARMFGLPPLPAVTSSAPSRLPMTAGSAAAPPLAQTRPTPTAPPKVTGRTLPWLEHQAAPFGLTITSTTGGQHAPHSYHYQGRAVDLGGPPARMAAAANYALAHPGLFTEMFYTGPGHPNYFISGGKVLPLSQLDRNLYLEHENHVHWAR